MCRKWCGLYLEKGGILNCDVIKIINCWMLDFGVLWLNVKNKNVFDIGVDKFELVFFLLKYYCICFILLFF